MSPWLLTAWLACQAFDEGTTSYGLHHGFRESNPLMQRARLPIRVSVNIGALIYYRKTHAKLIPVLMAATGCVGGSWNTYQLRKLPVGE